MSRLINKALIIRFLYWGAAVSFDFSFPVFLVKELNWPELSVLRPISLMHFCIALFELPTGAFADRYGRLLAVKIGMLISSLSFALMIFSGTNSNTSVVFPYLFAFLFALGWTFQSGAFNGWAINSIVSDDLGGAGIRKYFALLTMVTNLSSLIFGLLFGVLNSRGGNIIWVSCLFLGFASFFCLEFLKDGKEKMISPPSKLEENINWSLWQTIKNGVSSVSGDRALRKLFVQITSIYVLIAIFNQGALVHARNLVFSVHWLRNVEFYFWPTLVAASILGAYVSKRAVNWANVRFNSYFQAVGSLLFFFLTAYSAFVLLSPQLSNNGICFVLVSICIRFIRSFVSPLFDAELNVKISDHSLRATILSFESLVLEGSTALIGALLSLLFLTSGKYPLLWFWCSLGLGFIYLLNVRRREYENS